IENDEGGELRNIDNNGVAIGLEYTYVFDTGELILNEIPDEDVYRSVLYEDLTNDGKLIVGSLNSTETHAAYLKDGVWKLLPIPADDELFGLAPKFMNTSAAKLVSGDGSVIFGFLGSFFMPMLWYRNDAGEYEPDFFVSRFLKLLNKDLNDDSKPLYGLSAHYLSMSNNGKYVAFLGAIYDENENAQYVPVVYDTEEKVAHLYTEKQEFDFSESGLYPTGIANDGTFIGCVGQPYFGSTGSFIMRPGETQAELFIDAFPEYNDLLGMSDNLGFSVPTAISADGKKIVGYTYYTDNGDYNDQTTPAYYITYVITDGKDNAVDQVSSAADSESIYSIDGTAKSALTKGINIIRHADGTVTK
ncbi:MAG: hypothetical protein K2H49_04985, partial [Muribaculaceae bacterium]|nr:hypothetical protein [Muribaculaceae bacterium]